MYSELILTCNAHVKNSFIKNMSLSHFCRLLIDSLKSIFTLIIKKIINFTKNMSFKSILWFTH